MTLTGAAPAVFHVRRLRQPWSLFLKTAIAAGAEDLAREEWALRC